MSSDYRLRALSATRTPNNPTPHSSQRRRATALLAAAIGTLGLSRGALAATAVWDGGTNGAGAAWLLGTNWNPDLPSPGPGATDLAQFDATGIAVNIGIDANGATNNGAADHAVGQVLLSGGINRTIINSSTVVSGLLTLNGVDGVMLSNTTASGTLTLSTTTSNTLGVVLGTSGAFNVAADNGHITISSIISETGGARALSKTGAGTLTLGGINAFSGGMTIADGTVSVAALANAGVAQPLGMATFAVALGNATTAGTLLYTGADVTIDRGFALGAAGGGISTTSELTLTSAITGSGGTGGGGTLTKSGAGTLTLGGAGGTISGAAAVVINGGTLRLNNQPGTNNNDRISDATSVTLNGGVLRIDMDVDAPTTEIAGALHIAGGANVVRSVGSAAAAAAASTMTFNSIARSGGAVNFEPAPATGFGVINHPALANGILGGWATHAGAGWATIDPGTGNVVAYTGYNTSSDPNTWLDTDNVDASSAVTIAGNKTINSLRVSGGAATAVTVDPALTLNVGQGILATGATGHSIGGDGELTAGSTAGSELIVTVPDSTHELTIAAPIVNNGGGAVKLLKAGAGIVTVDGANTSYSGGTEISAGTLRVGPSGNLSNTAVTVGSGATFDVNNQIESVAALAGAGSVTLGDGALTFGSNGANTTYAGVISGAGRIIKTGAGTTTLTGVNTYIGGTLLGDANGLPPGGVLVVDADSRLGAASTPLVIFNGTLRLENGTQVTTLVTSVPVGTPGVLLNTNRNVFLHGGNGKIDVPTGSYAEIAGLISPGAAADTSPLHKIGGGTLDFRTASNTFTGGVIIDGGMVGVTRDANFGAVPASFDADAIQLNNGGTIKWYSSGTLATNGLHANRGVTIGAGGGAIEWAHSSGVPNFSTQITSAAGNTLTKRGSNTVLVQVAQPNMNGDLNINQGRWNMQVNGSAGNGTINLTAGETGLANTSVAQLGIAGTNLGLTITTAQGIELWPRGGGANSFEVNATNTLVLNGHIGGDGGLTKGRVAGTNGTLVLGGYNGYSGDTTILLGTLRTTGGHAIPDLSAVVIGSPVAGSIAVLDVTDEEVIGGLSGGAGGAVAGRVVIGSGKNLIVEQYTDNSFGGIISGAGGNLVLYGGHTFVLSGNNTYSGTTTIDTGTLSVGSSSNLGDGSASNNLRLGSAGRLLATGTIDSGARNLSVINSITVSRGGATVDTNGNAVTFGNVSSAFDADRPFIKAGAGTLTVNHVRGLDNVSVKGGTLATAPNGLAAGVSNVNTVTIAADARLDLTDNKLITNTAPGTADAAGTYTDLQREVQRAYNFTSWDQPGLTTSMADAKAGLTTIGISTGAQIRGLAATATDVWGGQTIYGASTLAMYTYAGDANLDGQIDAGDYGIIDNFVQIDGASGYGNGDFNYDGFIDAGDYGIIDNNVQAQGAPFSTSGSAAPASLSGVTAVPEPGAIALLAAPLASLLRRRRRGG